MANTKEAMYRNKYLNLVAKLHQKGYQVKLVDSRSLRDYAGMNPEAAKDFGKSFEPNTYEIDGGLNWEKKYTTLVHEINEHQSMKNGDPYWKAHCKALRDEYRVGGIS